MSETAENGSATDIAKKIVRQVEFYFGDYNLMRDTFMREKMKEEDGWFSMETMLKFKRLSSICSEPLTILEALETSKFGLIEIDMENLRIRRKPNREIPEDNEQYRKKLKARTVHVNGFQGEENIDNINEFLESFGRIEGVQLQRTSDKKFKGSLFATFFSQEDADKFIQAPMVYYKADEIRKMSKSDYFEQQNEGKKPGRKRKSSDKKMEKRHQDLEGIVAIKVSGLTDDTIIHKDVKSVFENIDVHTIRFFDRIVPMGSEGYLMFSDERTPEDLLKLLEEKCGGTTIKLKSADVLFSKPTDDEKSTIEETYIEARSRIFGGKKKGQRQQHGRHNRFQKKKKPPQERGKKTSFDSDDENGETKAQDEEPNAKLAKTEE